MTGSLERFAVVGVVGAGTMGAGIAQLALEHGHEVVLHDVDPDARGRARARIADGLARRVAKRGLADEAAAEATGAMLDRLRDVPTLDELAAGADLVIEAVLEDLGLKQGVFRALGAAAGRDVPLASNTSALSIAAIGAGLVRPDRIIGLHFFNPAPVMPLVEVASTDRTDPDLAGALAALMTEWGKEPVRCRDVPGFIVNRVNRPFTLEALRLLVAGAGSIEAVDAAIVAAGFPMGPFAYMDFVGLDVNLAASRALFEAFGHARFRPSPIQEALVSAGQLGRKTNRGFYRYGDDGQVLGPASRFERPLPGARSARLDDAAIAERITLAIVNEAFHALGDGVADEPTIDRAMRLGAAHPEGPFERAARIGMVELAATLDALAREDEATFRPALVLLRAVRVAQLSL
ncbi:MAG TPA: 3-hydroxyacyl-CoA dehydrogenase NAD-binding domain-containing protein, partial [Candidatus Limnocylindrales bacterium]